MSVNLEMLFHQLDIKNAFLNSDLHDEIYLDFPQTINDSNKTKLICKLENLFMSTNNHL